MIITCNWTQTMDSIPADVLGYVVMWWRYDVIRRVYMTNKRYQQLLYKSVAHVVRKRLHQKCAISAHGYILYDPDKGRVTLYNYQHQGMKSFVVPNMHTKVYSTPNPLTVADCVDIDTSTQRLQAYEMKNHFCFPDVYDVPVYFRQRPLPGIYHGFRLIVTSCSESLWFSADKRIFATFDDPDIIRIQVIENYNVKHDWYLLFQNSDDLFERCDNYILHLYRTNNCCSMLSVYHLDGSLIHQLRCSNYSMLQTPHGFQLLIMDQDKHTDLYTIK